MKHKNSLNNAILDLLERLIHFVNKSVAGRHLISESKLSLRGKLMVLLLILPLGMNVYSQVYLLNNANNGQTITTCSGTFYDSGGGGLGSDYKNNEDYTLTFCSGSGNAVKFDFSSFSVRSGDTLYVYDGPDTTAPLFGKYSNTSVPVSVVSFGTCLTFRFISNGIFTREGWAASISCCPPPVISPILPSDPFQCAGSTINYSVDLHAGSTYNWTVINGSPASMPGGTNNLDITWDPAGDVTGYIYVVEVNSCGSRDSSKLVVDINSLPVVDFTGLNAFYCIYSPSAPLTGSPSGGVFSGPGISGSTFTPATAGQGTHNITYTYTDPSTNCTNQKVIQTSITVPQVFNVGASANSYCAGFGVIITLSGSEAGFSYQLLKNGLNDGAPLPGTGSSLSWNNKQNGVYTVIAVHNLTSCTNNMSGSQTIIENTLPVPSFTAQPGAATCSSVNVTYSTQPGQSAYIWGFTGIAGTDYSITSGGSSSDNSVTLIWLTAGSKSVTINYTNASGCTAVAPTSSSATIVTLSPPSPTGAASQNFCSETSPIVANLNATGSGIQWYSTAMGGVPLLPSTPLSNNTHYYASQTVAGCESITRLDVTAFIFSIPLAPVSGTGTGATCSQITANWGASAGATSYRLDVSTVNTFATYVAGYQDRNVGNVTTFNVTGLTAGVTYYYRVRAVGFCGTSGNSLTISYPTLPATPATPGAITGTLLQCAAVAGQIYSISAVPNATTYTWTVPAGWSITSGQGTIAATVTTGAVGQNGNITVTAGNVCGTSAASALAVTVIPNASITSVTGASPLCIGGTTTYTANGVVLSGGTGAWSSSNAAIATVNAAGLVTGISPGTCNIIYAVTGGCGGTVSALRAVTINPNAAITSVTGSSPLCIAGTTTYTANGVILGGGTGAWSSSNPAVATVSAAGLVTGVSAGTCNIIYTITGGCGGTVSAQRAVTISPNAGITSVSGTTPLCIGGTSPYTANGVVLSGGTGAWSSSNAAIATVSATGLVTAVSAGTCNIIYTITGGCGGAVSAQQPVTINPNASITSVTGANPLCISGTATYIANGVVLSGGTGAWSSSNAAVATVSAAGLVTGVSAGTCNIIYTITGGCGGIVSSLQPVTINPNGAITSVTGASPLCIGGTSSYTANGVLLGGGTGAWSSSNPAIATVSAAGLVTGVSAGTCNIIYTISGSCGGTVSAQQLVTITPNGSITSVTGATPLCIGGTATYTANGVVLSGGTGAWSSSNPAIATVNGAGLVTGLSAGTCNIIYTISGGCGATASAQQSVTITPNASITSVTGTTPVCIGGTATYVANGVVLSGGTGAWSSSNSAVATVSAAGLVTGVAAGTCNIIYTVTGGCGGTVSAQQPVTINQIATITSVTGTTPLCIGGTTNFTANGVVLSGGIGTWSSSNPAIATVSATGSVTGVSAGICNIIYTITGGCGGTVSAQSAVTINANAAIASVTGASPICITGTSTYIANGVVPGGGIGTWSSSNPAVATVSAAGLVTGISAGTSNIIYTINGGCGGIVSAQQAVTVNPNASIGSVTGATPLCVGGTATYAANAVVLSGGTGAWSSSDPTVAAITAGGVVTGVSPGTANIIYTITSGCGSTVLAQQLVTISPNAGISSITSTSPLCIGGTAIFTANGVILSGGSGAWSSSNPAVGTVSTVGLVTGVSAGTTNIIYTITGGCGGTVSEQVAVTINPNASIASVTGPTPLCIAASATYNANGVILSGGTGAWISSNPAVATVNAAGSVTGVSPGSCNIIYTITGGCGGIATASASITVSAASAATISYSGSPWCTNEGVQSVVITGTPGGTFTALPAGLSIDAATGSITPGSSTAGTYTVTYTMFSVACGNIITTTNVTINQIPDVIINDPAPVCSPSTADLTDPAVTAGSTAGLIYTYWTDAGATISFGTPSAAGSGTYYIRGADSNGCYDIQPVTVVVNPAPSVSGTQTNVLCANGFTGAIDITALGGTAPYNYAWTGSGVIPSDEDQAGLGAGLYTVVVTDAAGCASSSAQFTITEPSAIIASAVVTTIPCPGASNGSIDLTVSGGTPIYSFLWSTGDTSEDLSNIISGDYSVTITDASGCTTTAAATVIELQGTLIVNNISCNGLVDGSVDLTVAGGLAPFTFLWSNGAGTEDISGLPAGDYSVTISDAGGCTADLTATIAEPLVLNGGLTVNNVLCLGETSGAVDLSVVGGTSPYSFLWDSGETTEDLSNVPAGDYNVIVTDASGCTFAGTATVTQPAEALTGSILSQTNIACGGTASGSVTVSGSGGTLPYEYSLDNDPFQASGVFDGLDASLHIITVRDANLCTVEVTALLTEPVTLSVNHTETDASCPDVADGSISLTIAGGVPPYSIIWSDGDINATRTKLLPGTYTVVVTDMNGCTFSDNIVIDYTGTSGCLEIPTIITPNNDGYNDTWIIRNIDLFPDAEVFVYNRWGERVFHTKNLNANPWDGTSDGKQLPTDSYHYVLHLSGSQSRSGVISIIR